MTRVIEMMPTQKTVARTGDGYGDGSGSGYGYGDGSGYGYGGGDR